MPSDNDVGGNESDDVCSERSGLLQPAPFGNEQRGRLGGLPQGGEVDIFVETVQRLAARAKAQARNVVVEPVEAGVGERSEDEVLYRAAIDGRIGLAERGFRLGRTGQLIAFREETRPFDLGRVV